MSERRHLALSLFSADESKQNCERREFDPGRHLRLAFNSDLAQSVAAPSKLSSWSVLEPGLELLIATQLIARVIACGPGAVLKIIVQKGDLIIFFLFIWTKAQQILFHSCLYAIVDVFLEAQLIYVTYSITFPNM